MPPTRRNKDMHEALLAMREEVATEVEVWLLSGLVSPSDLAEELNRHGHSVTHGDVLDYRSHLVDSVIVGGANV